MMHSRRSRLLAALVSASVWLGTPAAAQTLQDIVRNLQGQGYAVTEVSRTWLGRIHGPRFDRHVDIRKPGAKRFSARATTEWCLIDRATRRPKRIGEDILDTFALHGLERS